MSGLLGPMMVIVWKDLLLELRSKDLVVSIVVFGLLVVVVFNFALNNTPGRSEELAPGILWSAFAFSAVLAMNRAFVRDQEQGGLEGLLISPVSRDAIFQGFNQPGVHVAGGSRSTPGLCSDVGFLGPILVPDAHHLPGDAGIRSCGDFVLGHGGSDTVTRDNAASVVLSRVVAGDYCFCGGFHQSHRRRDFYWLGSLAATYRRV